MLYVCWFGIGHLRKTGSDIPCADFTAMPTWHASPADLDPDWELKLTQVPQPNQAVNRKCP